MITPPGAPVSALQEYVARTVESPSRRPGSSSQRQAALDQFLRDHPAPANMEPAAPTPVPRRLYVPVAEMRWLIGTTAPFWLAAIAVCTRCQGSFGRFWMVSLGAACGVAQGIAAGVLEQWIDEDF